MSISSDSLNIKSINLSSLRNPFVAFGMGLGDHFGDNTGTLALMGTLESLKILAHANCTPLLEEKDLKNDRLKNYFFWTFATHMTQIPPKKYNFTKFAAFFHFLFFKINYYFV